jgi:O-antigen/teichoic acid export membrane protein
MSTGALTLPEGRRIGLNAAAKLAAEVLGRVAQLLLTVLIARRLGEAGLGVYAYGIALGFVLAQGADLGLQLIVTREVAKNAASAPGKVGSERETGETAKIVGTALKVKLGLSVLVLAALALLSASRPEAMRWPTLAFGAAMLVYSYVEFFGYVFRGRQQLVDEAILVSAARVIPALLGIGLLLAGEELDALAWTLLVSSVAMAVLGYAWLRARAVVPDVSGQAGAPDAAWLLRQALPLGVAIGLSILYTRTSIFLLEPLQGPGAVGLYNMAQRLYEPLQILPAALLAAVFPAFARHEGSGIGGQGSAVRAWLERRTLGPLLLAGLGVTAIGIVAGPLVIGVLFGEQYVAEAGAALQLLLLAVPPMFLTYALTHFLIAVGQQRWNAVLSFVVLVVNIGLNVVLVPALGPRGAALALVVSEATLFVLALIVWRTWKTNV